MTPERQFLMNEWAKRLAIGLCFSMVIGSVWIGFRGYSTVAGLTFIGSLLPYIFYVRWLQPRIMKKG
jgi:hypothetical protein